MCRRGKWARHNSDGEREIWFRVQMTGSAIPREIKRVIRRRRDARKIWQLIGRLSANAGWLKRGLLSLRAEACEDTARVRSDAGSPGSGLRSLMWIDCEELWKGPTCQSSLANILATLWFLYWNNRLLSFWLCLACHVFETSFENVLWIQRLLTSLYTGSQTEQKRNASLRWWACAQVIHNIT